MFAPLLPCPFCENETPRIFQSGGYWKIKCDACQVALVGFVLRADAITRWNRRPESNVSQPLPKEQLEELFRLEDILRHIYSSRANVSECDELIEWINRRRSLIEPFKLIK